MTDETTPQTIDGTNELPRAPVCSPCADNEDGRCCGTGECWLCPLSEAERAEDALVLSFQQRVAPWMLECFGAEVSRDLTERSHRFLEEALELVQAAGCTPSEAHQLVDYVFGRPIGEISQEVGGVMVTLAALCLAQDIDMHAAGETELARVWTKIDVIREKHAAKPKHSPLPGFFIPGALAAAAWSASAPAERRPADGAHELFSAWWPAYVRGCAPLALGAEHRATAWSAWQVATKATADLLQVGAEREDELAAMIGSISDALGLTKTEQFEANGADKILARIAALTAPNWPASVRPAHAQGRRASDAAAVVPLPLMRAAFLTTETWGEPHPAKSRYSMVFDFQSIRDLHAAQAEWVAMMAARSQQATAPAEPIRLLTPQPAPPRDVVPGKVHCSKCGFTLQRVNLYVNSGTTGAGGEETEPCPNDGTPLLPVTWEQEARDAWKVNEQFFDRMHLAELRLAWLHGPGSTNVEGYEWGIYRVKWENGQAAEVWQTASDFSDLDAARALLPQAPGTIPMEQVAEDASAQERCAALGCTLAELSEFEQWRARPRLERGEGDGHAD